MKLTEKRFGKTMLGKFSVALGLTTILYGSSTMALAQHLLTHHMRTEVENGQVTYKAPMLATKILRLDIVLPLRNRRD